MMDQIGQSLRHNGLTTSEKKISTRPPGPAGPLARSALETPHYRSFCLYIYIYILGVINGYI